METFFGKVAGLHFLVKLQAYVSEFFWNLLEKFSYRTIEHLRELASIIFLDAFS